MRRSHGLTGTHEYWIWAAMLDRCRNPNSRQFRDYGGRGITVCERWHDFASFLADMAHRPDRSLTLERRDNSLGYGPDNCVWAPRSEQNKNKRRYKRNSSGVTGVAFEARSQRWRARIRVGGKMINIGRFRSLVEATEARRAKAAEFGFNPQHGE